MTCTLKPWKQLDRDERQARLGDPRIADKASVSAAWEYELIRRHRAGLPLSKQDARIARRLLKQIT